MGSYGMGGCGFFGLKLEKTEIFPEEYLVLTIYNAEKYIKIEGLLAGKIIDYATFKEDQFTIQGIEEGQSRGDDQFESFIISNNKSIGLDSWLDAWAISPDKHLYV